MTNYVTEGGTAPSAALSMNDFAINDLAAGTLPNCAARVEDLIAPLRVYAVTTSGTTDIDSGDAVAADASGGDITLNLPTPSSSAPWPCVVTKIDNSTNSVIISAGEQTFEGGNTAIILQGTGESVYLLPVESDSVWYWLVSARNGAPSIVNGVTVFLADPIWGGPVTDPAGDWTSAQKAAATFLESIGGGTIVYPAGTLMFGIDNTDAPGCLLPDKVFHVGGGREATTLQAASGMTANLMQTMAYGDATTVTQFPTIDHMTVAHNSGSNDDFAKVVADAIALASFDDYGNLSITTAQPPNSNSGLFNYAPVSGGTKWTDTAVSDQPGLCWVQDTLIQYTGVANPSTYASGQSVTTGDAVNLAVESNSGFTSTGGTVVIVDPINLGTIIQAYQSLGTNELVCSSWTGPSGTLSDSASVTLWQLQVCTDYSSGDTPASVPLNAEVKPFNSQGHAIALQAAVARIGSDVHVLDAIGSNVFLQQGGPSADSAYGHDICPSRIENPGRFQIEVGSGVTDGRITGLTGKAGADGFGGILISADDWDISHYHHVVDSAAADCPAVICAASDVRVTSVVGDTHLCPAMYLDKSGRYSGNAITDDSFIGYNWTKSSQQAPQTPTVPVVLFRSHNDVSSERGRVDHISSETSYSYGVQNGPSGHLGAPSGLSLPVASPFTIFTDNVFGFDTQANSIPMTNTSSEEVTVNYTGVAKIAELTQSQVLATLTASLTSGTYYSELQVTALPVAIPSIVVVLTYGGVTNYFTAYDGADVGATTILVSSQEPTQDFPATSTTVSQLLYNEQAGVIAVPSDTSLSSSGGVVWILLESGTIEQPYSSINDQGWMSFSAFSGPDETAVPSDVYVIQHQFTGCYGGSGTVDDGTLITQPAMTGAIAGMDVSGAVLCPGLLAQVNGQSGDTFVLTLPPAALYTTSHLYVTPSDGMTHTYQISGVGGAGGGGGGGGGGSGGSDDEPGGGGGGGGSGAYSEWVGEIGPNTTLTVTVGGGGTGGTGGPAVGSGAGNDGTAPGGASPSTVTGGGVSFTAASGNKGNLGSGGSGSAGAGGTGGNDGTETGGGPVGTKGIAGTAGGGGGATGDRNGGAGAVAMGGQAGAGGGAGGTTGGGHGGGGGGAGTKGAGGSAGAANASSNSNGTDGTAAAANSGMGGGGGGGGSGVSSSTSGKGGDGGNGGTGWVLIQLIA
jgi:hypothetical protein